MILKHDIRISIIVVTNFFLIFISRKATLSLCDGDRNGDDDNETKKVHFSRFSNLDHVIRWKII